MAHLAKIEAYEIKFPTGTGPFAGPVVVTTTGLPPSTVEKITGGDVWNAFVGGLKGVVGGLGGDGGGGTTTTTTTTTVSCGDCTVTVVVH